jgi:RHS repeat-associated protein
MVAFAENKILKGGGGGPTGDTAILNADFRTPSAGTQPISDYLYQGMTLDAVTGLYYERFRNYSPSLGTWISQDPLQYVNGANTYQFVESSPVGKVDAAGEKVYTFRASREFDPYSAGLIIAPPRLHLNYQYSFRYGDLDGTPFVSSLFKGRYSPGPVNLSVPYLSIGGAYHLNLGTEVIPDPNDRHVVLLVVNGVYSHYDSAKAQVGVKGVSVPGGPSVSDVTRILTFHDTFLLFDHCGKVSVEYVVAPAL